MEQTRYLEGLQAAKRQAEGLKAGLDCTPEAFSKLQERFRRSATTIVRSGAITELMDFADAMTRECKRAAATELKSD